MHPVFCTPTEWQATTLTSLLESPNAVLVASAAFQLSVRPWRSPG